MFSLSHVAAFIEVIETGSFHEASRRLQISQPTVSHNVKRLEDILGVRLVERRKDKCVPTRQGLVFLPFARSLLTVTKRSLDRLHSGRITLGASTNIGTYILPVHLKRLQDAQGRPPEVAVASNPEIIEKLLRKEIDLAFTEWWDDRKGYQARLWRKEKLVIIVSPQHNWRTRKTIEAAELFQESLIGGERGTGTGSVLREAFGQAAEQFPISFNVGSTEAVKHAVRAGLGISIVMRSTVLDELASGRLYEVSVENVVLEKSVWAVHPVHMEDGSPEAIALKVILDASAPLGDLEHVHLTRGHIRKI